MLEEKKQSRQDHIDWAQLMAFVLFLVFLVLGGYNFYRALYPTTDYWGEDNTSFISWYVVFAFLVVAVALISVSFRMTTNYERDYEVVLKGTVMSLYQEVEGRYATTYFYVVIEGDTAAGERSKYALSIDPIEWTLLKAGDEVDYS